MLPNNKVMDVYPCCHGNKVSLAAAHSIDRYCHKCSVPHLKLVSFQISPWCPFEAIAGLKYCQNVSLILRRIITQFMMSSFSIEVGKFVNCNCHN